MVERFVSTFCSVDLWSCFSFVCRLYILIELVPLFFTRSASVTAQTFFERRIIIAAREKVIATDSGGTIFARGCLTYRREHRLMPVCLQVLLCFK